MRVYGGTDDARAQVAEQIETGAFPEGKALHHGPHGDSPVFRSHFQTEGQAGHTFYEFVPPLVGASKVLKQLTASYYTRDWPGILAYVGPAVDFFNPISDAKDIVDLGTELAGGE